MKPQPKAEFQPSEEVFDEIDLAAIPAIREGLADLRAGRVFSADEVEKRLSEEFEGL